MLTYARTQTDGRQDEYSLNGALSCNPDHDKTRQEFAEEANINTLLARYGVQNARTPQYGDVDYDVGFTEAMHSAQLAHEAYLRLPREIRDRYPTWDALYQGVLAGEVEVDDDAPKPEETPVTQGSDNAPTTN